MKLFKFITSALLICLSGMAIADPLPCNEPGITKLVRDLIITNYDSNIQSTGVKTEELAVVTTSFPQVTGINKRIGKRTCKFLVTFSPIPEKIASTVTYTSFAIDACMATGIPDVVMPRFHKEVYDMLMSGNKDHYLDSVQFTVDYSIQMNEGSKTDYVVNTDVVGPYAALKLMAVGERFHRNGDK